MKIYTKSIHKRQKQLRMCVRKELLLIANQEKCEYLSKSFTKINGFLPEEIVNYYNTDTNNSNNSNNLNNILDFKDNSIYQKKILILQPIIVHLIYLCTIGMPASLHREF